jgi:hypothetical protein
MRSVLLALAVLASLAVVIPAQADCGTQGSGCKSSSP